MAVEPEEGGKLAHGRLQSTLPVRAKTRSHTTITPDETSPGTALSKQPWPAPNGNFSFLFGIELYTHTGC
jgi:hypothetical protein